MISIVIPTYNDQDIHHPINGVLNQTCQDWELLIVDDGSSQEHLNYLDSWKSDKVRILKRPGNLEKGANSCRNIGIENARGEYIALLDADDYWLPNRLEKALEFLNLHPDIDAIYSGGQIEDQRGLTKRVSRNINPSESSIDFLLSSETWAPTPSMILKKKVQVRFDESLKRHQDYDFFIRVNEGFQWGYFENFDVIVRWDGSESKKTDFDSCLKFYHQHKEAIANKDNELLYLFGLWKTAILNGDKSSQKRLKSLMRKVTAVSTKMKILSIFPELAMWKGKLDSR